MKFLRFVFMMFLTIISLPLTVIIGGMALYRCIRTAKSFELPVVEGIKEWWLLIRRGIEMNKDFIINGL